MKTTFKAHILTSRGPCSLVPRLDWSLVQFPGRVVGLLHVLSVSGSFWFPTLTQHMHNDPKARHSQLRFGPLLY